MKESIRECVFRWLTVAIVLAVLATGLVFAWPTYMRRSALRREDVALSARIEDKRREIADLAEKRRRFECDPDFVEAIARKNRRVFPGELVFIYEDK